MTSSLLTHNTPRSKQQFEGERPLSVACFHDFSGHGAAGLNVALPVLSAYGLRVSALPGALLSTQTDGFGSYVFRDQTEFFAQGLAHWQSLDLRFDWMYSGFLGSAEQMLLLKERSFLDRDDNKTKRCIDPVLGDEGQLYATMGSEEVEAMRLLCRGAYILTPNLTELLCLLGRVGLSDPKELVRAEEELLALSDSLKAETLACMVEDLRTMLDVDLVVLTGVVFGDSLACYLSRSSEHEGQWIAAPRIAVQANETTHMPGTGDLFCSILLAVLARSWPQAAEKAVEQAMRVVSESMQVSLALGLSPAEGPCFQSLLATKIGS